jgi:hypothetical protein
MEQNPNLDETLDLFLNALSHPSIKNKLKSKKYAKLTNMNLSLRKEV